MSGNMERSLTVELNVKKKRSDLGSLTNEAKKASDGLDKVQKSADKTTKDMDKLDKSAASLKDGLKNLATSAFLLGSAGAGIEKLVMSLFKLEGAIRGLKGAKSVFDSINSMKGMGTEDRIRMISRMTGYDTQSVMTGARSAGRVLSKYGMPMGVGGAALGGAGLIMSGVNAADNFFTSRGAKPWLGHGSYDRNASGELYGWSPTRMANQLELSTIGGGKMDRKGDIISNDELMARQQRRMVADTERQQREMHYIEMQSGAKGQSYELSRQQGGMTAGFGMLDKINTMRNRFGGELAGNAGDLATMKLMYGPIVGAERHRASQAALGETGKGLGAALGGATAADEAGRLNLNRQAGIVTDVRNRQIDLVGGKQNDAALLSRDKADVQETQKLLELEKQRIEQIKARTTAQTNELVAIKDQTRALAEQYSQEASAARQAMRGSKISLGSMAPIEARITLGMIKKAREKGFESLTPEMRQRVGQFLPEEFNQFAEGQTNKLKVGGKSFDDIMKGSIEERKITDVQAQADSAAKKAVELQQQIDIKVSTDEEALAKRIAERIDPIFKYLDVKISQIEERERARDQAGQAAAAARANNSGAAK